jgi:hypothetical protein
MMSSRLAYRRAACVLVLLLTALLEHQTGGTVAKEMPGAGAGNLDSNPNLARTQCIAIVGACVQNIADRGGSKMAISSSRARGNVDFESDVAISNKIDSIHHAAEN